MIISTPKIDDMSDFSTLTMSNTLANAQITADLSFRKPAPANSIASPDSTENTLQPCHSRSPSNSLAQSSSHGETYVARVGFDTLGCDETSEYAFTLQAKTDGWKRTKHSRTFLVGIDLNDYSFHALKWLMDNMVEDGDEVVALRVAPTELRDSLSKSGIPSFQGNESAARQEAGKIMESVRELNVNNKEISIVVEYMVGNVRDTIQHMIKVYQPDMLVVGTRGRSSVKGFLLGSVSRYCLHHVSVPVIVVRPERKLNKSKHKAKGIFRRRTSVLPDENQGYQPHPTSPIHMSTSEFDLRNSHTLYGNRSISPQSALFPSATIHAGDRFPGRPSPSQNTRPLMSLFERPPPPPATTTSPPPATTTSPPTPATTISPPAPGLPGTGSSDSSPASSVMSSTITLPPPLVRSPAPPPPDGILKMKKSLTTDGTSKGSNGRGFGKSGGFLSGSTFFSPFLSKGDKEKEKEKEKERIKRLLNGG